MMKNYDGTMIMPANYAVVTNEEMTYLDGGVYISKRNCKRALGMAGLSASMSWVNSAVLAKVLWKVALGIPSVIGKAVVGAMWAVSYVTSKLLTQFAKGIAGGAIYNGVNMTWSWKWGQMGIQSSY